jgi:hypothetical protein
MIMCSFYAALWEMAFSSIGEMALHFVVMVLTVTVISMINDVNATVSTATAQSITSDL